MMCFSDANNQSSDGKPPDTPAGDDGQRHQAETAAEYSTEAGGGQRNHSATKSATGGCSQSRADTNAPNQRRCAASGTHAAASAATESDANAGDGAGRPVYSTAADGEDLTSGAAGTAGSTGAADAAGADFTACHRAAIAALAAAAQSTHGAGAYQWGRYSCNDLCHTSKRIYYLYLYLYQFNIINCRWHQYKISKRHYLHRR